MAELIEIFFRAVDLGWPKEPCIRRAHSAQGLYLANRMV